MNEKNVKKISLLVVIIIALIVLVLIAGIVYFVSIQNNNRAQESKQIKESEPTISTNILNKNEDNIKTNYVETSFTEEQIKTALANYLELRAHAGCSSHLEYLNEKGKIKYDPSKNEMKENGVIVTSIKYSDYKDALLTYMSESLFESNWSNNPYFNENTNGYYTTAQGGGGLRIYTIKSITKEDESQYKAHVSSEVDGDYYNEEDITFSIKAFNGNCVINSFN